MGSTQIWTVIIAITGLISTVAYIATVLYLRAELKTAEKDRFLSVTSELFAIWQDPDFMKAQTWLLYKMEMSTWAEFVKTHRGDYGEIAFQRVGSFYDRVGTLIRLDLVNSQEILSTVGGHAIAVWQKIESLVKEARRIENSALYDDFERMLPECFECYVPALGEGAKVQPFSNEKTVPKITVRTLNKKLDARKNIQVLDVRQPDHIKQDPRKIPGAVVMTPDSVGNDYAKLNPDQETAVYCA